MTITPCHDWIPIDQVNKDNCPFCGSDNTFVDFEIFQFGVEWYYVGCVDCQARGPMELTEQRAIKVWNEPERNNE